MNLFIGNLSPEATEEQLRQLFSEFGGIKSIKIPLDNETGLPRGFGFVEMEDKFEGYDAIDNLDTTYFMGSIISVKESKPKNQGGGNRGGGFNRNRGGGFNPNRQEGGRSGGGFNRNRNYNSNSNGNRNFNSNNNGGGYNGGGYNNNNGNSFNNDRY